MTRLFEEGEARSPPSGAEEDGARSAPSGVTGTKSVVASGVTGDALSAGLASPPPPAPAAPYGARSFLPSGTAMSSQPEMPLMAVHQPTELTKIFTASPVLFLVIMSHLQRASGRPEPNSSQR